MDYAPSTWEVYEFRVHGRAHMASIDRHSYRQMRTLSKFEWQSPKPGDESKSRPGNGTGSGHSGLENSMLNVAYKHSRLIVNKLIAKRYDMC